MTLKEKAKALTLEEKTALLSGTNFMYTNAIPRLNIPSLCMADGPHGVRKQIGQGDNGVTKSEPATAFPTAATVACSWNPANSYKMGKAIAEECLHYGVNILLGPGINIKKNPLCGRNFEYFSEDPLLTAEFGSEFVRGVQELGVAVSLKHFAANNAENYRFVGDSAVDERALQEIYLKAFEKIIKKEKPYTVMSAYNKINGTLCSESDWLLTELLRKQWGFDGVVMSDWGGTKNRSSSVSAGMELEMPGDTAYCRADILKAVQEKRLDQKSLDTAVENVLRLINRCQKQKRKEDIDRDSMHKLAEEIAIDSAILLKNENNILPLNKKDNFLVVGDLFYKMRYQGSGSSMINPTKIITNKSAFDNEKISYTFLRGYEENDLFSNKQLLKEIKDSVKEFEKVIFFGGLTDYVESEGGDREDMKLPENQLSVLTELIHSGIPIIVVLFGGSPMELPFADQVDAILNMVLPGQNGGNATTKLLFGEMSPSGRLSETWPYTYQDVPFGDEFSKKAIELYKESIYVGYRYYVSAERKVRYPFGYGLSYTKFEYRSFKCNETHEKVDISLKIKNVGNHDSADVVQLYVGKLNSKIFRAMKELRAFKKIYLKVGEEKEVILSFDKKDLAIYHPVKKEWQLENGIYTIELGKSVEESYFSTECIVENGITELNIYSQNLNQIYSSVEFSKVDKIVFEELLGYSIQEEKSKEFTMETILSDYQKTFFGRMISGAMLSVAEKQKKRASRMPEGVERENTYKGGLFLERILSTNSFRTLSMSAGKTLPYNLAEGLVEIANGHLIKGIRKMMRKITVPPLPSEVEKEG